MNIGQMSEALERMYKTTRSSAQPQELGEFPSKRYDDMMDAVRYTLPMMTRSSAQADSIMSDYGVRPNLVGWMIGDQTPQPMSQQNLQGFLSYSEWLARSSEAWKMRSDRCAYCGSLWYPNRFHPGNCDSCGGPR